MAPYRHIVFPGHLPPELTFMVLTQVAETHWGAVTDSGSLPDGHDIYMMTFEDGVKLPELVQHCELCRQVGLVLFTPRYQGGPL